MDFRAILGHRLLHVQALLSAFYKAVLDTLCTPSLVGPPEGRQMKGTQQQECQCGTSSHVDRSMFMDTKTGEASNRLTPHFIFSDKNSLLRCVAPGSDENIMSIIPQDKVESIVTLAHLHRGGSP